MSAPAPDAPRFAVLDDAVAAAREMLPSDVLAYLEGGAEDELTLVENRRAFSRWFLRPRMLSGAPGADPATTFLGMPISMPLLVAPFAGDTLLHADGYRAVLEAAAAHGTIAVVPEVTGKETLEALAAASPAARVFQVSLRHPESVLVELLQRAADAGYSAICVTIDVPVVGVRRRENRHPGASVEISNFEPGSIAGAFMDDSGEREPPWTWARLADAMANTPLPCAVKGVLTAADARAAVGAGAAAVYVSNHGGRQLDGAPATLDQLGEVVDEIGGEAEVAIDGGVRSGSDIVKALALGADVVLVGRPVCYGLVAGGGTGVHRVLEILRHELVTAMTLLGRTRVADLDRSLLQPARR